MAEQLIEVAKVDELKPGQMRRIECQGRSILLANVDGNYLATDDMCTHEDASLTDGALNGDLVTCPLHGSRFSLRTGAPIEEPAEEALRVYPVRIEGDSVMIAL